MPSEYLAPADYDEYGLSEDSASSVRRASALIDTYLNRDEGLVWAPDSLGRPAYMTSLQPSRTLQLQSSIVPGSSVVIAVPYATYDLIGEVFVLDRANDAACEPVTVSGVDQINGTITLLQVLKPHAAQALLEAGLQIVEERQLPAKRSLTRISRPDLAGILSAVGRYGYCRRSDQFNGYGSEMNLLASLQTLGATQVWQPIDITTLSASPTTGEVWIGPGLMLAYFSEVRLRYVAGFSAAAIPAAIKQATANVVNNLAEGQDMSPIYKVLQAGGTKLERFSSSFIDGDTQTLLSSYKLRSFV